jgi:hypothetical protein
LRLDDMSQACSHRTRWPASSGGGRS